MNANSKLFMLRVVSTQLQFLVQFLRLVDEHLSSWCCLKPDNPAYVGGIAMEMNQLEKPEAVKAACALGTI